MNRLCAYCEKEPAVSETDPLCASCAARLKRDPTFAQEVVRHLADATKVGERMRARLAAWTKGSGEGSGD